MNTNLSELSSNPEIIPLIEVIDKDNGDGYSKNIKASGHIIKLPNGSNTRMLYEIKTVNKVRVIFIRYIHYDNKKELLNLLAFASQWWMNMKPNMIYYKEKDRDNEAGSYLVKKLGFQRSTVKNELLPFDCLRDSGTPCICKMYEYTAYKPAERKKSKTKKMPETIIS